MIPEPSPPHVDSRSVPCDASIRASPLPKLHFPSFDGDNPRLWRDHCDMLFEVFSVNPSLKTRFAALNFKGTAATWLQTFERRGRVLDWGRNFARLSLMVLTRINIKLYQIQLKQLDCLRQTSSVTEYIEEFERLSRGILLYNNHYDATYLVTQFLCGLQEEIRTTIALHLPRDVQTTSSLALIQEEAVEQSKRKS